jgi:putative phosphoribosyl transferase
MFRSRFEAGSQLAQRLGHQASSEIELLAIPRGGIEVGHPIALFLRRPLDVIVPRKIPCPDNPELAIGAVTFDGGIEIDEKMVEELGLSENDVRELARSVQEDIERRLTLYRGNKPRPQLNSKPVVLIDDGLATGYTMIAGIKSVRQESPSRLTVVVPVSPASTYERVRALVDELIVLHIARDPLFAVSGFYDNFRDLRDEELIKLLDECNRDFRR